MIFTSQLYLVIGDTNHIYEIGLCMYNYYLYKSVIIMRCRLGLSHNINNFLRNTQLSSRRHFLSFALILEADGCAHV